MYLNRKKSIAMTAAAAAATTSMPVLSATLAPAFVARNLRSPQQQIREKICVKSAVLNNISFDLVAPSFYEPSSLLDQQVLDIPSIFEKSLRSKLNVPPETFTQAAQQEQHRPVIVGHRGCVYEALENTRYGFLKSYELGSEGVELDVFLLKCGTLVVFHGGGSDENPGDLTEYCNLPTQSILDYTAQQARQLPFNPYFAEFGCGPHRVSDTSVSYIPTLKEVLQDIKHKTDMIVKIELKGPGTPDAVLKVVEELDMADRCHYSSFNLDRIARIRELRPERNENGEHVYKTGALFNEVPDDFLERSQVAGASEVHLRYDTCSTDRIEAIHKAGLGSMTWFRGPRGMKSDTIEKYLDVGNEDSDMYRVLMRTGVQQMCVNKPNILAELLSRKGMTAEIMMA